MASNNFKIKNGANLQPTTQAASEAGDLRVDSGASNALKYYDTAERTVVNADGTQTLSNKTFSDSVTIAEISTPSTPSSGFGKVYFKSDGFLYQLNDGGTETKVGSGSGGGGINYASANPDAEANALSWTTYADGATATPVDLTGGSPTATWTRSTSSPLRGAGSFLFTAGALGNGTAITITPERADVIRGAVQVITIEYEPSATIATGDYTLWVYDVANSVLIQPTGYQIPGLATGVAGKHTATFQLATNSTTLRVAIHQAVASPAGNLKVDNVVVGPQISSYGAPVTDWVSYTPTGSWVSNTTYTGQWRRVGDSMEVQCKALCSGAPTSAAVTFTLPSGYSADTSKLVQADDDFKVGIASAVNVGVTNYPGFVSFNNSTSFSVKCFAEGGSVVDNNSAVNDTTPFSFGSGDFVTIIAMVPILGWGSGVVLSDSADTRVVACRYELAAGSTLNNAGAVIPFAEKIFDTHSALSSGVFTSPVPGIYRVSAHITTNNFASGAIGRAITATLRKNSSTHCVIDRNFVQTTTSVNRTLSGSADVSLNAGDTLDLFFTSDDASTTSGSQNECHISIDRISGPATIAASETVVARYRLGSNQSLSNGGSDRVNFDTKDIDTHGAVTTGASWVFTAPTPGIYEVSSVIRYESNATGVRQADVQSTGTPSSVELFQGAPVLSSAVVYSGSTVFNLLAGQTVYIRAFQNSGGALNAETGSSVSIKRL